MGKEFFTIKKTRKDQELVHSEPKFFSRNNYENTPMQYTVIFHIYINDNFQIKNCDIFLIFAQNIDCGNTLEPPH